MVLPVGDNDVSRISSSTRVIAVNAPDSNSLSANWGGYHISIDALEAATGLDLLSALSTSLQAQLQGKTDMGPTN